MKLHNLVLPGLLHPRQLQIYRCVRQKFRQPLGCLSHFILAFAIASFMRTAVRNVITRRCTACICGTTSIICRSTATTCVYSRCAASASVSCLDAGVSAAAAVVAGTIRTARTSVIIAK